jgi:hypothetical protein
VHCDDGASCVVLLLLRAEGASGELVVVSLEYAGAAYIVETQVGRTRLVVSR